MEIKDLTIKKFSEGLRNKEFSAFEVTKEIFGYIEKKDNPSTGSGQEINAYLRLLKDSALEQASKIDVEFAQGKELNILAGAPLAIKDNILIEGELCTSASKILENYKASYNATVIEKLKEAGAIFLGKTNMDEFAMGSSTENSGFKTTKNPRDLERVPGGSSGGSAAAVAADMCVAALGSDTGGSIRQPASFCGTVGLKPTYGAVSRYGLMAMASSLDQIGPLTKTVEDAEILFNAIKGKDLHDATSVELDKYKVPSIKYENLESLTIGLPKEYFVGGMDGETELKIQEAIKGLKSLKINFKEISLPHTKYALSCYYIIMPAEVSANLSRFDGIRYSRSKTSNLKPQTLKDIYFKTRGEGFGDEVKRRIMLGTFVLSSGYYDAYYAKAQKVRKLIKEDFEKTFKEVDLILTPVSPTPAFKIGEKTKDPLEMYLSDIFTIPLNLAGLPGMAIPVKSASLPVGFQLIAKPFHETALFEVGKFYERINGAEV
ncbi:MAG: Asp-tRNA(Asn)/Glu-tRNA(Gln) amidotransferase subunit GatA [Patescibacteria group bacterium]